MNIMKSMSDDDLIERKKVNSLVKELQEKDICPSCIDDTPYHDNSERIIYKDEVLTCFFEEYPRNPGHTIILINKHHEDISKMPLEIGMHVIKISKILIEALNKCLNAEKVYMCTMCDGKKNSFTFSINTKI